MHLHQAAVLALPPLGARHVRQGFGDAHVAVFVVRGDLQPVDSLQQLGLLVQQLLQGSLLKVRPKPGIVDLGSLQKAPRFELVVKNLEVFVRAWAHASLDLAPPPLLGSRPRRLVRLICRCPLGVSVLAHFVCQPPRAPPARVPLQHQGLLLLERLVLLRRGVRAAAHLHVAGLVQQQVGPLHLRAGLALGLDGARPLVHGLGLACELEIRLPPARLHVRLHLRVQVLHPRLLVPEAPKVWQLAHLRDVDWNV
mmetsp:Transcript_25057/g.62669  ORF Transcript_25057/g.62669 Transcript_25057/m.62669 type:complete len:253 (+) Transcript_25057:506-1264(+)